MKIHCILVLVGVTLPAFLPVQPLGAQTTGEAVVQRESIRRQEILLRAIMEIESTQALIAEGKLEEAEAKLAAVLGEIPQQGEGAPVYDKASGLLADIYLSRARAAYGEKKWFDVRDNAIKSIGYRENNPTARDLLAAANAELGIRNNDERSLNPAVDRKFVGNINEVSAEIDKAKDLMATGQWDAAESALSKALNIDPYNKVAALELRKIYRTRAVTAAIARKSSRQERMTETREGWTQRIETEKAAGVQNVAVAPLRRNTNFALNQKLNSIILPTVDFNDATIADAAAFLTQRTRELDPTGVGVSVVLKNDAVAASSRPFSLKLSNVPAGEVLRYVANLAGVKFRVEEFAVFIVALAEPDNTVIITREFPVRPTFFEVATDGADTGGGDTGRRRSPTGTAVRGGAPGDSILEALKARGVSFNADGSAAFYNQSTGILTVKNTQDQIDLVEELVTDEQGEALVVKIDTRLIEINQTDLESLVPNFSLLGNGATVGGLISGGTGLATGAAQVSTSLAGVAALKTVDGIDPIIQAQSALSNNPTPPSANKFGITGALDGNGFRVLLEALNQKTSKDLMTAPSIVVNDGAQGTITVAREFYYPTEFDEPQVETGIAGITAVGGGVGFSFSGIAVTAVPAFPSEFEARNVGVVITVQPRITVDRKRVFLTLKPEVTEFDGFINYGSRIFHPILNGDGSQVLVNDNIINQPVFSVRTVENAQLEIEDGYTMVLGGLIREDVSTVEDKVPLLGDIPLIGRAFRSKSEQAIKKNLLIFVSVRILRPDGEPYNPEAGVAALAR